MQRHERRRKTGSSPAPYHLAQTRLTRLQQPQNQTRLTRQQHPSLVQTQIKADASSEREIINNISDEDIFAHVQKVTGITTIEILNRTSRGYYADFEDAMGAVAAYCGGHLLGKGANNKVFSMLADDTSVLRISYKYPEPSWRNPLATLDTQLRECLQHRLAHEVLPDLVPAIKRVVLAPFLFNGKYASFKTYVAAQVLDKIRICSDISTCPALEMLTPKERNTRVVHDMLGAAVQLCNARLYHGDIHTGNLMYTLDGPRLVDFDHINTCFFSDDLRFVDVQCDDFTAFGSNMSSQTMAPESLATDSFIDSITEKSVWRSGNVLCIMSWLAEHIVGPHNTSQDGDDNYNPFVESAGIVVDTHETRDVEQVKQNLRALASVYNLKTKCERPWMNSSNCFEAAQIFAVAMDTFLILTQNHYSTDLKNLPWDNDSIPIDPHTLALLMQCLHPFPESRPTAAELAAALRL